MQGARTVGERVFGGGRRGLWRRAVTRRLLAAGLAAGTVLGCLAVARTPDGGPRVDVVVAARGLPAGHELEAADLVVASRPADYAPGGAPSSASSLVGRRLAGPVTAGEVMTDGRVVGAGLLAGRPANEVAAHVSVADRAALAMVRAGVSVDIITGTGATVAHSATVLAVGPAASTGAGGLAAVAGLPEAGLVVAVTPDVASRLAGAARDEAGGAALSVVVRHSASLR